MKVSEAGRDCGMERVVVTTRAASYSTPISRMAVHFSTVRERVTQVRAFWSAAEWKSIQRKVSGAG